MKLGQISIRVYKRLSRLFPVNPIVGTYKRALGDNYWCEVIYFLEVLACYINRASVRLVDVLYRLCRALLTASSPFAFVLTSLPYFGCICR